MKISDRKIGVNFSPYIIAEMSANHNGNIDNAYPTLAILSVRTIHSDKATIR